ncbi:acyl-CoA carboxylase subunit beta [Actinoplanes sp. LDG1-06]|uniref:Acyl-CoA carboxylase subunit beta n=1 Tax=Paractinoplanes ovalisporus TaxID=2810368 RepID=A0ABS2AWI6_9ACTN|nr:carboxyl transferase domain-containing protein [Actinoplanes ovalisporus]MBM2623753.1 acyl-CoA carboxylase subunit beta [Actinoplanes ovalisporus]
MTVTAHRPAPAGAGSSDPIGRMAGLLDACSLRPLPFAEEDGVAVARGAARGVPVIVFAVDPRVVGGAVGAAGCDRIVAAIDLAVAERAPVVGIWQHLGARLDEGAAALDGVSRVFGARVRASGRIPQISVVVGPAAGGSAYGPALGDVVITTTAGRVLIPARDVVRRVAGAETGAPYAHGRRPGVAHVVAPDAPAACRKAGDLVSLLGAPGRFAAEVALRAGDPRSSRPDRGPGESDVRSAIEAVLDDSTWSELQPRWAAGVVTGLGRLAGRTVGVVAGEPIRNSLSAEKAARFVNLCDDWGIPRLILGDVPGRRADAGAAVVGVEEIIDPAAVRRRLVHAFAGTELVRDRRGTDAGIHG